MSIGIGSKIWRFNANRRVYGKDRSRPIWREHWEPFYIVGENRASWLLAMRIGGAPLLARCPKKRAVNQLLRAWAFSEAEIDEQEWDQEHRWKVMQRAERELTTAQVREVAKKRARPLSSPKTCQDCGLAVCELCWPTLPASGSMQSGRCSALPTSARRTSESDSSLWLPTPSASIYGTNRGGAAGRVGPERPSLQTMAAQGMWATPTVKGNYNKAGLSARSGDGLSTAVAKRESFPTQTARNGDPKRGMPSPELAAKRFKQGRRNLDDAVSMFPTPTASMGKHGGLVTPDKAREGGTLIEAVSNRMTFPTPTARDWKSGASNLHEKNARPLNEVVHRETPGPLNPEWVEALMSFEPGWTEVGKTESPASSTASPTAPTASSASATRSSRRSRK